MVLVRFGDEARSVNVELVAEVAGAVGADDFRWIGRGESDGSLAVGAPVVMVSSHSLDSIYDNTRTRGLGHSFRVRVRVEVNEQW